MSKVKIGLKYPVFAPVKAEPANALPTYDAKVVVGEAMTANLTINLTNGDLFSDDALNIRVSEFSSGSIALETDGLDDTAATAMYGATATDGLVVYNVGDVAPNGGLAYYTPMRDKTGKTYFKCHYFPKVQAAMGADNATTKGSSVTFSTANTTFTVMKCENGDWMHTEVVDTETEAKTWVDACLTSA